MRVVLAGLVLLVPVLASSQPRIQKIESAGLSVTTYSSEEVAGVKAPNVEVVLRGLSIGHTNTQGELSIRGFSTTPRSARPPTATVTIRNTAPLIPLSAALRDSPLYAAYAPPNATDGGAVILLDSPSELTFMLGDRPHALLDGPVDWRCSGVAFAYDVEAETLHADPVGCSDPAVLALTCPDVLRAGEVGEFSASVQGDFDFPVRWTVQDTDGVDMRVEQIASETEGDRAFASWREVQLRFQDQLINRSEAIVTASLGDGIDESCLVAVGELGAEGMGEEEYPLTLRVALKYNLEFGSAGIRAGGSAPLPVGAPLVGDISLGYFDDSGRGYMGLNAELLCQMAMTPMLTLFYGGGLHLLRQSSNGNSDLEVGPGATARVHYDGGWPVDPIAEVNASYLYGRVIPTLSVGAAYRFNQ
ncbi:MAG: hypothetical protein Rubg2KO_17430 [Rubricoccaceae bacterium]